MILLYVAALETGTSGVTPPTDALVIQLVTLYSTAQGV